MLFALIPVQKNLSGTGTDTWTGKTVISVIIPVYNEEGTIRRVLDSLTHDGTLEVIVVDGGSSDRTVELASRYPVTVIRHIKNRALQMNRGARAASGDGFLFLHADCLPGPVSLEAVARALASGYVGGCLTQRILGEKSIFRFIEGTGNARARRCRVFYGDQAIFVRRDIFFDIGGFQDTPLFEDIFFSKDMRRRGEVTVLPQCVFSSSRRWRKRGIVRTTLTNWLLTTVLLLGVPPQWLKRLYKDIR